MSYMFGFRILLVPQFLKKSPLCCPSRHGAFFCGNIAGCQDGIAGCTGPRIRGNQVPMTGRHPFGVAGVKLQGRIPDSGGCGSAARL